MNKAELKNIGFRRDINGMRAWAVVLVMLFHFKIPGFSSGFIGVDIFFVISGFLMTQLVLAGLNEFGLNYSLLNFYMARARRIFPTLLVLCFVLLVIGWFSLPAPDYKKLADHTFLSILFFSNVIYYREFGYFDLDAHEKWLLHTWSLSVEWQFYLIFPVLLWLIWRWRASLIAVLWILVFLMMGSFFYNINQVQVDASAGFYLLFSRTWEMLIGACVAIISLIQHSKNEKHWLEIFGGGLVFAGMVWIDPSAGWPGWQALVPTFGVAMVLLANRQSSLWTRGLVLQWFGDRSYSLYLWHWPVVVLLHYAGFANRLDAAVIGLMVTMLLGYVSYRWIETPSRLYLGLLPMKKSRNLILGMAIFLITPAVIIIVSKGWPGRVNSQSEMATAETSNTNKRILECHLGKGMESPGCVYGGHVIRAIVLGDSHADAIVTAVAAALPNQDDGILELTYSACPVLRDVSLNSGLMPPGHECANFINGVLNRLKNEYPDVPVIIVNRWAQYVFGRNESPKERGHPWINFPNQPSELSPDFIRIFSNKLVSTACEISRNHPVFLVQPIPEIGVHVPKTLARSAIWGGSDDVTVPIQTYLQRQEPILKAMHQAQEQCGVQLLDPTPYLCWDNFCHGAWQGRPMYHDDDHLSEFGNRRLIPMLSRIFQR